MAAGWSVMDALNKNSKAAAEDRPKARFRTRDISIRKMYSNDKNFYSMQDIDKLAQDILLCGMIENLTVTYAPCDRGEYRIIAGERRWRALKMLVEKGYQEFEIATCQIKNPEDEHEETVQIIIANAYRDKTVADILEEEKQLKESLQYMRDNGLTLQGYRLDSGRLRDIIAQIMNTTATKVAQIESINKRLIPEFSQELKEGRLTFSAAYELSGMQEEKQQDMLERYRENGLTWKEVKEAKAAAEETAKEEQAEMQTHIEDYGMHGDPREQQDPEKCVDTHTEPGLFPDAATGEGERENLYPDAAAGKENDAAINVDRNDTYAAKTQQKSEAYAAETQQGPEKCVTSHMEDAERDPDHVHDAAAEVLGVGRRPILQEILEREKKYLRDLLEEFKGEPEEKFPKAVWTKKILVEALSLLAEKREKEAEEEPIQMPLPIMRNNDQRKDWLRGYREWGLWYEDKHIGCRYYKYDFENGARLIVEEYLFYNKHAGEYTGSYYHLVGGPVPEWNRGMGGYKWQRHEKYNKFPNSEGELVEFLKCVQRRGKE